MAVLLIIFSSIAILQVETESGAIQTAEDAIWWTTTTLIGQAEAFPTTTEGKVIAIVLMTYGVGIFGTFTAYIASLLVSDKAE
jgi:voltage-gated potassium channel